MFRKLFVDRRSRQARNCCISPRVLQHTPQCGGRKAKRTECNIGAYDPCLSGTDSDRRLFLLTAARG